MREAVIVDAVRSARGKKKGGAFVDLHPQELLAKTIQGALNRVKIEPKIIEDVVMGCVTPVGEQGLNIARGAALASGLPIEIPGVTINRFCGSGQQAVHFAAQAVMSGAHDVVFAGGIESMSRVAMGSDAVGNSERNTEGPNSKKLLERFPGLVPQGISAEMVATKYGITRAECDAFAFESQKRAGMAIEQGRFKNEITV